MIDFFTFVETKDQDMNEITDNFKKVLFANYANFEGRASRSEYWLFHMVFQLLSMLLFVPLFFVAFFAIIGLFRGTSTFSTIGLIALVVGVLLLIILCFAMIVPSIAVTARRLHDVGYSGWYMLIGLIPMGSLVVFAFLLQDSVEGANEYGDDPKAEERSYYRILVAQQAVTATASSNLQDEYSRTNENQGL